MASYKKLMIGMVCATAVGASACYGKTFSEKLDACFEEHRAEIQERIQKWNEFNLKKQEYNITESELAGVVRNAYDRTCRWMKLMVEWHLEFFDYFKERLIEYNEGRKKRVDEFKNQTCHSFCERENFTVPKEFFIDDFYIGTDPKTGEDAEIYGEDRKNVELYESYLKEFFIKKGCELALETLKDMIKDFAPKGIPHEYLKKYADVCNELLKHKETLRKIPSLKAYLEKEVCSYSDLVQDTTNNRRYFLYTENDRYAVERINQFFGMISLPEIMWKDDEGTKKTCRTYYLKYVPEGVDAILCEDGWDKWWEYTLDITWYVQHGEQCNLYRDIFRNGYIKYAKYNPEVVEKFKVQTIALDAFPRPPFVLSVDDKKGMCDASVDDKKGMCDALLDEALRDWLNVRSDLSDLIYCACCGYKHLKDRLWLLEAKGEKVEINNCLLVRKGGLEDHADSGLPRCSTDYFKDEIIENFNDKFIKQAEDMLALLEELEKQFENKKIEK